MLPHEKKQSNVRPTRSPDGKSPVRNAITTGECMRSGASRIRSARGENGSNKKKDVSFLVPRFRSTHSEVISTCFPKPQRSQSDNHAHFPNRTIKPSLIESSPFTAFNHVSFQTNRETGRASNFYVMIRKTVERKAASVGEKVAYYEQHNGPFIIEQRASACVRE